MCYLMFRLCRCRAPRWWRPPGGNAPVPGIQLRCARWPPALPVQLWDPFNSVSLIHCCARWPPPLPVQLWDLRNSVSPIREFHGHAKGVLAMSWCPQDSSFLLSSGKDNRTICWDVNAGALRCAVHAAPPRCGVSAAGWPAGLPGRSDLVHIVTLQ